MPLVRALALACLAIALGCAPAAPAGATWAEVFPARREVARGYVVTAVTRGHEHDVVVSLTRPRDGARVEVHVLDRGRWSGVRETGRFGVAWEMPRTTAPRDDAEAVTEALTHTLSARGALGPTVDAVPLDRRRPTARDRGLAALGRLGTWRVVPWWLLAAVAFVLAARRPTLRRDDLALTAAALAARALLGARAPFHVNGQGALWILGATQPAELRAYGPGFAELHGLLARAVPPDVAVFSLHALLSALTAPLVAAVARELDLDEGRACLAGALVAADPALVRVAATEAYVTPILALTSLAAWLLLRAAREASPRTRGLLAVAGALVAAQCARVHPLAWTAVAALPLLLARRGPRAVLAAAALVGGAVALTSGCVVADVLGALSRGALVRPTVPDRAWWPLALVALAPLALRGHRALLPAALASALGAALVGHTYGQSPVWRLAAVHAVALPVFVVAGAFAPALRGRGLAVACAAVGALVLGAGASIVRYRTTDEAEYAWSRAWLASAPRGCRVAWVAFAGARRTVFLPTWAHRGATTRLDAREALVVAPLLTPLGCTYYVRTTACDTPDGAPACDAVERQLTLRPVARARFAAVASHRGLPYATPTVTASAWRVEGFARP